jgi:sugar O-acyltransferase (sialic acid O-acetyltransferase NeuD family)
MKPIILVGGGGHCKSCIDVIDATGVWEIKGILDQNFKKGQRLLNYPIIGTDEDIDKLIMDDNYFLVTVGQIKSAAIRKKIYGNLKLKNAKIATIISPKATVSKYAGIGTGTIVHHNCVINADAQIGENNIINSASVIEHDTVIGNNNHISTCAVLNGNVTIGNDCFIGSGVVIANGISITDNILIGAGSLVIRNINEPGTYAGSPVKRIGL